MSAIVPDGLHIYLIPALLTFAYTTTVILTGLLPISAGSKSVFLRAISPIALVGACEFLGRFVLPDYTALLRALELALAAYFCIHLIDRVYIGEHLVRRRRKDVSAIVRDTIKAAVVVVFVLVFLRGVLHWNLAAILTPSAIMTAIIGLAMQDTIGNFISGILIQVEKPFDINDWIEIEGQQGQVRELNWRYTKIETLDHYYIVVPNSKIATQKVVNYSKPTPDVNEFLSIGVSYDVPPLKVKRAIESILEANPHIVKGHNNGVFLHEYGDSSVNYKIKYAIEDFSWRRAVRDEVLSAVWYQFRKRSIEIPFPIRTVIMRKPEDWSDAAGHVELLAGLPFFEGVSRRAISTLLQCGIVSACQPGAPVCEAGEEGDSMFFVLSGEFGVVRDGHQVATLCRGDFFGEMSLLTGEKRNARVECRSAGDLLEVDRNAFRVLLDDEPAIMQQIENVFNQRALANREMVQNEAKRVEIKRSFWNKFKNLFGCG